MSVCRDKGCVFVYVSKRNHISKDVKYFVSFCVLLHHIGINECLIKVIESTNQ